MGTGVQGLQNVSLDNDTVRGLLIPLPLEHNKFLTPRPSERIRIKKKDFDMALTEVHLYTNQVNQTTSNQFAVPLSAFTRVDVYELNQQATNANHTLSTVGIAAGGLTVGLYIAAIITLVSECNCPHLYLENDGQFQFTGGLYSGAIYSTLERTDYFPLQSVNKSSGELQFRISNTRNEEQFINQVQLMEVSHPAGTKVLPDRYGRILSYLPPELPAAAISGKDQDETQQLAISDGKAFSFDNNKNSNGYSSLELQFKKPAGITKGKLVINARNSKWAGYIHEEFLSLFGSGYPSWRERQEKADPAALNKWQTDQAIPLMVYVKSGKNWKFVDYFPLIGNLAGRDMILELADIGNTGDDVTIRLETAYRFWELDFAGMDFSTNAATTSTFISPATAIHSSGSDESVRLASKDSAYSHLVDDESILFKYHLPHPDTSHSYFLASGGYYHNLKQYTGTTKKMELLKFRKKGAFDQYSRSKYVAVEQQFLAMKKNNVKQ